LTGTSNRFNGFPSVRETVETVPDGATPSGALYASPTRLPPAFTLIEIMVVVGIMGLVLLTGVPIVYKVFHRAPMTEALIGVQGVCSTARAQAIMQGRQVDLVLHPRDGRLEIEGAAAASTPDTAERTSQPNTVPAASAQSVRAVKLPERISLYFIVINRLRHNFADDELARVRFFPNSTSDEATFVLMSTDMKDERGVTLEVTTGLASVLSETETKDNLKGLR
jgi:prepilin-type N-terminal cleavage/methylation domain-containing protein